jgi:mannose-6-phosphate isomerase-like protein (cupin superfamily)
VPPWRDHEYHLHDDSEEYYFVFNGELHLQVADAFISLKTREALMVKPGVPHAVVGGKGSIEHFVLRLPAHEDRQHVGELPHQTFRSVNETKRELLSDWGCRIPLTEGKNQNCWLFGFGEALFHSAFMCLAYLNFPSVDSVNADIHPHRMHLHQESWEYYAVLSGSRVLQVEETLVEVSAGQILEVPPEVKHRLYATETPFEGFTFRTPLRDDKREF